MPQLGSENFGDVSMCGLIEISILHRSPNRISFEAIFLLLLMAHWGSLKQ